MYCYDLELLIDVIFVLYTATVEKEQRLYKLIVDTCKSFKCLSTINHTINHNHERLVITEIGGR